MNMYIGENIKRLRQQKNVTQERLAEHMNISAPAVSKWERGETFPDITMVMPLALYFGVSVDELMGFNAAQIEESIQKRLNKHNELQRMCKFNESAELIAEAHREYPNDFRIMVTYMYNAIDGRADNSKEKVLDCADEFIPLCGRILKECTTDSIRYEAAHILAKIYRARGDIAKALSCYDNLPNWYETKNQLLEQLYDKNTEEFRYYVNKNMYELLEFAFNKVGKAIWYTADSVEDREKATSQLVRAITDYISVSGYEPAYNFIVNIYHEGAKVLNSEGNYGKACEYYEAYLEHIKKFSDFIVSDRATGNMLYAVKDLVQFSANRVEQTVEWMSNTPFLEKLRGLPKFNNVIEKYRL